MKVRINILKPTRIRATPDIFLGVGVGFLNSLILIKFSREICG